MKRKADTTLTNRFWDHVDKTGACWLWTKGTWRGGYGMYWFQGKNWRAHRLTYTIFVGSIPKGMCVLHNCDTPRCCNPAHLKLGTDLDNKRDMFNRGRHNGPPRSLNPAQILEIRKKYKPYGSSGDVREFARRFSCSTRTIVRAAN